MSPFPAGAVRFLHIMVVACAAAACRRRRPHGTPLTMARVRLPVPVGCRWRRRRCSSAVHEEFEVGAATTLAGQRHRVRRSLLPLTMNHHPLHSTPTRRGDTSRAHVVFGTLLAAAGESCRTCRQAIANSRWSAKHTNPPFTSTRSTVSRVLGKNESGPRTPRVVHVETRGTPSTAPWWHVGAGHGARSGPTSGRGVKARPSGAGPDATRGRQPCRRPTPRSLHQCSTRGARRVCGRTIGRRGRRRRRASARHHGAPLARSGPPATDSATRAPGPPQPVSSASRAPRRGVVSERAPPSRRAATTARAGLVASGPSAAGRGGVGPPPHATASSIGASGDSTTPPDRRVVHCVQRSASLRRRPVST